MSDDLAGARRRLSELAETCERTDTGDGVMETPLTEARQLGADLRAVLGDAARWMPGTCPNCRSTTHRLCEQ